MHWWPTLNRSGRQTLSWSINRDGPPVGTPAYRVQSNPWRLRPGRRSDLYSRGVLYRLLTAKCAQCTSAQPLANGWPIPSFGEPASEYDSAGVTRFSSDSSLKAPAGRFPTGRISLSPSSRRSPSAPVAFCPHPTSPAPVSQPDPLRVTLGSAYDRTCSVGVVLWHPAPRRTPSTQSCRYSAP